MVDLSRINRPVFTLGALLGALGIGAAARASHGGLADLAIAANFMMLHAPAFLAISLLNRSRMVLTATLIVCIGLAVFAGDLAMRDLAGHALFPMAAPSGGFALMLGWVLLGASVWVAPRRT